MENNKEKEIMEEKTHVKSITIVLAIVLLLDIIFSINVGYAYENKSELDTSNINGKFEVIFENAYINSQEGTEGAKIDISSDMKNIYVNGGNLKYPGAYVEYKAEILNNSTVSAKIESIKCEGLNDTKAIKISGFENIAEEIILKPGEKYNIDFIVKWDEEYNEEVHETTNFVVKIDFIQDIEI